MSWPQELSRETAPDVIAMTMAEAERNVIMPCLPKTIEAEAQKIVTARYGSGHNVSVEADDLRGTASVSITI